MTNTANNTAVSEMRFRLRNGSKIVANAYWSISDVPNVAMDEVLTTKLSLSYVATPTRYTS